MLEKEKMNRINELARTSKERELHEHEKAEQAGLRTEYLDAFRKNFKEQLDCIELVDGEEEESEDS